MTIIEASVIWNRANTNYKRACTVRETALRKGRNDLSVKQTRKMYHAAENLRRTYRALYDARQVLDRLMK